MLLKNNKIVITGGGTGIGRALAMSFQRLGNDIIIAGQERFAERDAAATPGMKHLPLDQDDPASITEFAYRVKHEHPTANVLINNAGIQRVEDLTETSTTSAEETISTNLLGPMRVTAALMPQLLSLPHATIINITSALAFVPLAIVPTYSATKAAFHSYTQSLRYQLRNTNIQVIEVVPAMVQTGLQGNQGYNPLAQPLDEFITEVMDALSSTPSINEITVERAKALRFAERDGQFHSMFETYNKSSSRK